MIPATSFQQGVPSPCQFGPRYGMLRLTVSSAVRRGDVSRFELLHEHGVGKRAGYTGAA